MKRLNVLAKVGVTALIATSGIAVLNEPAVQEPTIQTARIGIVQADTNTYIKLPAGYTKARILKVNNNKLSASQKKALIKSCMQGMAENTFYGDEADKSRIVDVTKLSPSQKEEISKYTLSLINSARHQMGKRSWTYRKGAVTFADKIAQEYYNDNMSCWQPYHDVAGIERAAKKLGLNYRAGQVYEDESGLPITSEWSGSTRSMYALKKQIYFNVKQMLFGGFYGTKADYQNASRYTEWEHAGDLLGLRSMRGYDAKTKYFGVSFSVLPDDQNKVSVHMIGVAKRYIRNYKQFNK